MPVLSTIIGVKHTGLKTTEFKNTGANPVTWRACFQGKHEKIVLSGREMKAEHKTGIDGREISFVTVIVKPGATLLASI